MRKKDLVGPGGVVLNQIEAHYGVVLDLSQEGQCLIYGEGGEDSYESGRGVKEARNAVNELVADVEIGENGCEIRAAPRRPLTQSSP